LVGFFSKLIIITIEIITVIDFEKCNNFEVFFLLKGTFLDQIFFSQLVVITTEMITAIDLKNLITLRYSFY
jgi:hypothetical protein